MEAAYQQMQAETSQMTASSQLPEAQEQALDEYPMPDEQVSTPDMQEYGYSYDAVSYTHLDVYKRQAQSVVAQAAGIINSDASIDISSVMTDLEPRLMEMDLGPLFGRCV